VSEGTAQTPPDGLWLGESYHDKAPRPACSGHDRIIAQLVAPRRSELMDAARLREVGHSGVGAAVMFT